MQIFFSTGWKTTTTTTTTTMDAYQHPLDPLTLEEILAVTNEIRGYIIANHTAIKAIKFFTCSLLPAPKRAVLAYLGIPLEPGAKPETPSPIVRRAEVDFVDAVQGGAYNAILRLKDGKWAVEDVAALDKTLHPQISPEELMECEMIVRKDARIQQLAKEVGILPEQIYCDGWSIGYDDRFPHSQRVQQAFVYARFGEHENLYAHPMDFVPIVDSNTEKVIHIDFPSSYTKKTENGTQLTTDTTSPPPLDQDALKASGRDRIPVPPKPFDFLPDLMEKSEEGGFKQRTDLKPLHVVQPEGVSFKMNGHELEWQNWKMHIAFSQREGIAISTVTYNDHGEVRPIFYRLSLAEMVVPYGAPEFPQTRKFAFDSGEYGMGTMANELSLGCDCLGTIHYMPGAYVTHSGRAFVNKNVICIHEEDAGVLWKHSDYRVGGRGHTVRRRRLVVSMVCTLANYEYIWNYHFYQDGSIEFEVRLTGILQVGPGADGEESPYGTLVAPNILAHYHQHMFCLRVDPIIDGLKNTVIESDVSVLPDAPTGSAGNYAGNAFVSRDTVLEKETGRPYDWEKERRWRIVNNGRTHYSSGKAAGYAIGLKSGASPMMARPDSFTAKRSSFLPNTIWVCRDVEGKDSGSERVWPSGKYVPMTRDEPEDSIGKWVQGKQSTVDEDLLVYINVGVTHIPRPEDWPVMPVEHVSVTFKPNSFFKVNPSMDVPGSKDSLSVPAFPEESPLSCCAVRE